MAWTEPKVDWTPEPGVADVHMNAIGNNLVYLKAHADATAGMHGAIPAATANKLIIRDAAGRAKVMAPNTAGDIAILSTVTAHTTDLENPHETDKGHVGLGNVANVEQMPLAGGTFTGAAAAKAPDTSYTTAMLRNIKLLESVPGVDDLENGEIGFVYE